MKKKVICPSEMSVSRLFGATNYIHNYQMKDGEMGGTCNTHWNLCEMVGEPEGRDQLEDIRIDFRVILKWVLKMPHDRGQ